MEDLKQLYEPGPGTTLVIGDVLDTAENFTAPLPVEEDLLNS
jgi:hypothetical protein